MTISLFFYFHCWHLPKTLFCQQTNHPIRSHIFRFTNNMSCKSWDWVYVKHVSHEGSSARTIIECFKFPYKEGCHGVARTNKCIINSCFSFEEFTANQWKMHGCFRQFMFILFRKTKINLNVRCFNMKNKYIYFLISA